MTRALQRAIRRTGGVLRSWRIDRRGIAAVEFALVLPLMVAMFFGGVEIAQAIMADRKVTLVTRTVADLVAQSSSVSNSDMSNILSAATAVVYPFDSSVLAVTVSSVTIDGTGKATIAWSDSQGGTPRTVGSTVTLPAALAVANTSLIMGEAIYSYKPVIGYTISGTLPLSDNIYMRPRVSASVARTS